MTYKGIQLLRPSFRRMPKSSDFVLKYLTPKEGYLYILASRRNGTLYVGVTKIMNYRRYSICAHSGPAQLDRLVCGSPRPCIINSLFRAFNPEERIPGDQLFKSIGIDMIIKDGPQKRVVISTTG